MFLNELVVKRTYYKICLKRLYIEIIEDGLSSCSLSMLESSKQRCLNIFQAYEECHIEILCHDSEDSEDVAMYEDMYLDIISKIGTEIKNRSVINSSSMPTIAPRQVNLPSTDILQFTGRYQPDYVTLLKDEPLNITKNLPLLEASNHDIELQRKSSNERPLGLTSNACKDTFVNKYPDNFKSDTVIKGQILNQITKFSYPMHFVCDKTGFPASPSKRMKNEWTDYNDLILVKPINMNRNIRFSGSPVVIPKVRFADAASSTSHGACLYLCVVGKADVNLTLLCSKSILNPIAKTLSTASLVLNRFILLARLAFRVYTRFKIKLDITDGYLQMLRWFTVFVYYQLMYFNI